MSSPAWASPKKRRHPHPHHLPVPTPGPSTPSTNAVYTSPGSSSSSLSLSTTNSNEAPYLTHLVRHHGQYTLTAPPNLGKMRLPSEESVSLGSRGVSSPGDLLLSENAAALLEDGRGDEATVEGEDGSNSGVLKKEKKKKKKVKKKEPDPALEASIVQAVLNAGRTPSPLPPSTTTGTSGGLTVSAPPMLRSTSEHSVGSVGDGTDAAATAERRTRRRQRAAAAAAADGRAESSNLDIPAPSSSPSPSRYLDSHATLSGPLSSSPPPPAYIPPASPPFPPSTPPLLHPLPLLPTPPFLHSSSSDQDADIFFLAWEQDRLNGVELGIRAQRDFLRRWGNERAEEWDWTREIVRGVDDLHSEEGEVWEETTEGHSRAETEVGDDEARPREEQEEEVEVAAASHSPDTFTPLPPPSPSPPITTIPPASSLDYETSETSETSTVTPQAEEPTDSPAQIPRRMSKYRFAEAAERRMRQQREAAMEAPSSALTSIVEPSRTEALTEEVSPVPITAPTTVEAEPSVVANEVPEQRDSSAPASGSGLRRKRTTTERFRDSLFIPGSASGLVRERVRELESARTRRSQQEEPAIAEVEEAAGASETIREEEEESRDRGDEVEEEEEDEDAPARTVVNARQLFLEAAERRLAQALAAATPSSGSTPQDATSKSLPVAREELQEDEIPTPTASKLLPFPGSPSPPDSPTTPIATTPLSRTYRPIALSAADIASPPPLNTNSASEVAPPLPRRPPPRPTPPRPPASRSSQSSPSSSTLSSPSNNTRRHSRPAPPPPLSNHRILGYIPQADRQQLIDPIEPDRPTPSPITASNVVPLPVTSSILMPVVNTRKPLPIPPRQTDKVDAFTALREREREYTLGVLTGEAERRRLSGSGDPGLGDGGASSSIARTGTGRPSSETSSLEAPPPVASTSSGLTTGDDATTPRNDESGTNTNEHDDFAYTDLDLLLARLEQQGAAAGSNYDELILVGEVLGPVKAKRAKEEDIASLPVARVELERRRIDKFGKVKQKLAVVGVRCIDCTICLSRFRVDDFAVALPRCLHVFHSKCIDTWLRQSHQCPVCRVDVFEEPNIEI